MLWAQYLMRTHRPATVFANCARSEVFPSYWRALETIAVVEEMDCVSSAAYKQATVRLVDGHWDWEDWCGHRRLLPEGCHASAQVFFDDRAFTCCNVLYMFITGMRTRQSIVHIRSGLGGGSAAGSSPSGASSSSELSSATTSATTTLFIRL